MKTESRSLPTASRGAVLLATLLAATLLCTCATKHEPTNAEVAVTKLDDLAGTVREVVTDEVRATQLVALVTEMQSLVAAQDEALAAHDRQIKALLANYETSDSELQSAFANFNTGRDQRVQQAVKIAQQIRAATTPEQWSGLNKTRKKALNAVTGAARQN